MESSTRAQSIGAPVPLDSVLCTEELKRRSARPPDHRAETRALLALAEELANSPESVLQRLVDAALELCQAHSAGISLLESSGPPERLSSRGDHFRWHAVAGRWAPLAWSTTTPRGYGPCGTVLDRDTTLLFSHLHRHFTQFADVEPLVVEALLVPFHVGGHAVGTVWVVSHDELRRFDAEDKRLLESLATFAAAAYQARLSTAALATANHDLRAEVGERERAEAALREADARKSEFLAMLAHELRNPLAPICNAARLLRLTNGEDASREPLIDMVERHVGQVVRLVDDLLDVSRISLGRIELRRETLELRSLVSDAVEAARPICERLKQQFALTLPSQPIELHADPTRLSQVVGNLLSNACKFSENGAPIRVIVERERSLAVVRVQDDGIGIDAAELPRIFDIFAQVDTSLGRSRDGLGIGLTLVKKLVEMHGGSVEARSEGLNRGSEFVVRLPLLAGPLRQPRPQSLDGQAPTTIGRRILVVDDSEDAAISLAMLLRLRGHEVHLAHDGLAAVELAEKLQPDAILLDIGLPGLDGYEAVRRIRAAREDKGLLTVALTGWGQEEDRRRSAEAGFDAHLVKPVDLGVLTDLLAQMGSD